MKITQEADYALRIVCKLAQSDTPSPIGAALLATAVSVPSRFAVKILGKLSEAGIVASVRGSVGGYVLTEDPARLTLCRVIEAIDGTMALRHCLEQGYTCSANLCKEDCRLHCLFASLNEMIRNRLERVTVAMVVSRDSATEDLLVVIQ